MHNIQTDVLYFRPISFSPMLSNVIPPYIHHNVVKHHFRTPNKYTNSIMTKLSKMPLNAGI